MIRHRLCIILVAVLASTASVLPATAACRSWDVSGRWKFLQTNSHWITLNLVQRGGSLTGSATHIVVTKACSDRATCRHNTVSADGNINGNSFTVAAYWSAGSIGVYEGRIGPQGRIEGTTYDKRAPQSRAQFHSTRLARCRSTR